MEVLQKIAIHLKRHTVQTVWHSLRVKWQIQYKDGKMELKIVQIKSQLKELKTKLFKSQFKSHELICVFNIQQRNLWLRFKIWNTQVTAQLFARHFILETKTRAGTKRSPQCETFAVYIVDFIMANQITFFRRLQSTSTPQAKATDTLLRNVHVRLYKKGRTKTAKLLCRNL